MEQQKDGLWRVMNGEDEFCRNATLEGAIGVLYRCLRNQQVVLHILAEENSSGSMRPYEN